MPWPGNAMNVVMALEGVHKRFGATRALDGAGITLYAGEVHALVGENGAGKSTLIKTMTGIYQPDDGRDPHRRRACRTELVGGRPGPGNRRHLPGADDLPGPQRGREHLHRPSPPRPASCGGAGCTTRQATILRSLDIDVDPRAPANTLAVAAQQAVEIAKAISLDARVLIMDEPTASLSAHEVDRLFDQVNRLRDRGVAVLFISHRLDEVFRIADKITVFRDGRHISTRPTTETNHELLVREMVGRDIDDFFVRTRHVTGDDLLAGRGARPRRHVRRCELRGLCR